ncbi:MAG: MaoC family protein [Deltaproteobacteria bacterium]|nr:MaoC family protein [Deltaproteobacteria bacterium]MBW2546597.1 MaoC family protein [Deltaproteobacteria bacterium]MBW2719450.1 MaoC family protein [Deltaproteobacteria bacterium]RLB42568.1 MAG: MaoC family protein [Deltaproteobacteria bacterium]
MTIDAQSLGYETSPIDFNYTWRDTVVYALGVGASADAELEYLYEGRGPKVLPTFCTIPTFAAFDALVDRIGCDRQGMVHHSQQMNLFKPLRPNGQLRVTGKVAGLYDLKRLAMAVLCIDAHDEDGDLITRGEVTLLLRNDGGFGGERPPKTERVNPPRRAPDFEIRDQVGPTQALLYRLSGDYNPLHADPDFAAQAGFDRPLLHGLCTYGYAGRAVVKGACGGDPDKLATLRGQFSNPVFPGDMLIIRGWNEGERLIVSVTTEQRPDKPCLSNAYAVLR